MAESFRGSGVGNLCKTMTPYLPGESMNHGCQLKATNQKCQVVLLIEPNSTLKLLSSPAICKLQATKPTSQISQNSN
jgi:hypothetical protein